MVLLTDATSKTPLDSIASFNDRVDWPAWLDSVTTTARSFNIWQYVDPTSQLELAEPQKPSIPTRPTLTAFPVRESFETDKVYDVRVEQERGSRALALREYDILYEEYRMDTAKYLLHLATYKSARENLQKLRNMMLSSLSDTYRAYLNLDGAQGPRAMIKCLLSRVGTPTDKDLASDALRTFNGRLKTHPDDDRWESIEAMARAAVELHRFKGPRFDQGTAIKDLAQALQVLDKAFVESLPRKPSGNVAATLLEVIEDFKYKMRRQGDKKYTPELNGYTKAPNTALVRRIPTPPNESAVTYVMPRGYDSSPASDAFLNFIQTTADASSLYSDGDETDWTEQAGRSFKPNGVNATSVDRKLRSKPDVDSPNEDKLRNFEENVYKVPKDASLKLNKEEPEFVPRGKPSNPRKKGESCGLTKKICPGCELNHVIRDDAWWETCYVYHEMSGLGNVPSHFVVHKKVLNLANARFASHPEELRRAEQWATSMGRDNNGTTVSRSSKGAKSVKERKRASESYWRNRETDTTEASESTEFNLW